MIMQKSVYFLTAVLSLTVMNMAVGLEEYVCGGVDMRNSPMAFLQPSGVAREVLLCTVIEGDVHVILMVHENMTANHFAMLRVLTSLEGIFPELRVIRGETLIHNYAFVMTQNADMVEIGLPKLTEISRGGARIMQNPNLCYADTINWREISKEPPFVDNNKQPNMCYDRCHVESSASKHLSKTYNVPGHLDVEPVFDGCARRSEPFSNATACWNSTTCQKTCPHRCKSVGLSCSDVVKDLCCHPQCVGGCSGATDEHCYACRSVYHENRCLPACPPGYYKYKNRRCLTKEECEEKEESWNHRHSEQIFFKAINLTATCSSDCPAGYEEDSDDFRKCRLCPPDLGCTKKCKSLGTIQGVSDAQMFKGCNVLIGFLDIEIHSGMSKNIVQTLGEYLSDLREVTEYVKISFTPSFVALDFLKNLQVIRGQHLYRDRYALSVLGNANLARLWDPVSNGSNSDLTIERGGVQFHNNHQLCYNLIMTFLHAVNMSENVTEHDVSKNSNGERAICEKNKLQLRIVFAGSEMIVCGWKPFNTSNLDHRLLLGYQVYYKEVQSKVLNIYENRDACSDSWLMVFHPPSIDASILRPLKPNTLYAVYGRTLMVDSAGSGAISDVVYATTAFQAPSAVVLTSAKSVTADSIELSWDPPIFPNGEVTHYKITHRPKTDHLPRERDYCIEPPDYVKVSDEFTDEDTFTPSESVNNLSDACQSLKCCNCDSEKQKSHSNTERSRTAREKVAFENAIQNSILTGSIKYKESESIEAQERINAKRSRRHMNGHSYHNSGSKSVSSELNSHAQNATENLLYFISVGAGFKSHLASYSKLNNLASGQLMTFQNDIHTFNVTTLNVTLTDLKHFTAYEIKIWACQNVSVPQSSCSSVVVYRVRRTLMIESKDMVEDASVKILDIKDNLQQKRVLWRPPIDPNGLVVSYEVEYSRDVTANMASKTECISAVRFNESAGVLITDLLPGNYSLKVRAVTLAQRGPQTRQFFFNIPHTFAFSNTAVALVAVCCSLAALVSGVLLVTALYRRWISKKYPEYLMGIFSANPDYISQIEVYKKDKWEVNREDIELLDEIGRGSFGTVYKGLGHHVQSKCGVVFGDCAVKTVAKTATLYDRFHFLAEASIMKSMKTQHVVKLYGVVSEGQPALVIMEYMAEGNLKEHLMKRRPENNNFEQCSTPTLIEVLRMACQIADGMAYLAAKKFCHRDLAARNCMVSADKTVKIGDFGMTRDVQTKDYYRPCGRRLMPVRWMSPEAIEFARFSTQSDVWSYGVVLWEIVTLASQPYPGLSNDEVRKYVVEEKFILKMPNGCPLQLWNLMVRCWEFVPDHRPTFEGIIEELLPCTEDTTFHEVSYYHVQRGRDLGGDYPHGSDDDFTPDSVQPESEDALRQQQMERKSLNKNGLQKTSKIGLNWFDRWFCPSSAFFEQQLQRSEELHGIGVISVKNPDPEEVETQTKDFLLGYRLPSPLGLLILRWPSNLWNRASSLLSRNERLCPPSAPLKVRNEKTPDQGALLPTETLVKV